MPTALLKKTFYLFLLLFALTATALAAIDSGLRNPTTPLGIISFEFCYLNASCEQALAQWGAKGQALAMLSLGIDYLYLLLYPGLIGIGLLLLAPRLPARLHKITILATWSCPFISAADAIENYALIQILLTQSAGFYGLLAGVFASIKFILFGIALLYLLIISLCYGVFNWRQ